MSWGGHFAKSWLVAKYSLEQNFHGGAFAMTSNLNASCFVLCHAENQKKILGLPVADKARSDCNIPEGDSRIGMPSVGFAFASGPDFGGPVGHSEGPDFEMPDVAKKNNPRKSGWAAPGTG